MNFHTYTHERLLKDLEEERAKFVTSSPSKINALINELINRGVYPRSTCPRNPNTVHDMVSGWGAKWHLWKEPLQCPHCKVDLRNQETGPPFKREIVISINDRMTHYECPDCHKHISRSSNVKAEEG